MHPGRTQTAVSSRISCLAFREGASGPSSHLCSLGKGRARQRARTTPLHSISRQSCALTGHRLAPEILVLIPKFPASRAARSTCRIRSTPSRQLQQFHHHTPNELLGHPYHNIPPKSALSSIDSRESPGVVSLVQLCFGGHQCLFAGGHFHHALFRQAASPLDEDAAKKCERCVGAPAMFVRL